MQTYVADLEVEDSFVGWGSLGLGLVKITVLRRLLVDSRALEGYPPPAPVMGSGAPHQGLLARLHSTCPFLLTCTIPMASYYIVGRTWALKD